MNLKAIAAAGALALLASTAHATTSVTYYDYGVGAPALTLLDNFSADTVGSAPASAPGYTWTGGGQIFKGTSAGTAAPATSLTTVDTGNYLSTLVGNTTTLTLAKPLSEIEVYIGSLDTFNTISFSNGDSYTGTQLGAVPGVAASSSHSAGSANGVFDFKFTTAVSSVTFSDNTANSFEVASIYASAVPEPATWAMMLTGLFGLGMAMRFARRGKIASSAAA